MPQPRFSKLDPLPKRHEKRQSGDWRAQIGRSVRVLREVSGRTQADLAAEIGADINTISSIERGLSAPDYATLEAMADLFTVPVDVVSGRKAFHDALAAGDIPAALQPGIRQFLDQVSIGDDVLQQHREILSEQGLEAAQSSPDRVDGRRFEALENRLAILERAILELQTQIPKSR